MSEFRSQPLEPKPVSSGVALQREAENIRGLEQAIRTRENQAREQMIDDLQQGKVPFAGVELPPESNVIVGEKVPGGIAVSQASWQEAQNAAQDRRLTPKDVSARADQAAILAREAEKRGTDIPQ